MKKLSSRFSIAVHILTLVAMSDKICTSEFIASSVNTNPVLIRRITGYLKNAGLVKVQAGTGGTYLEKEVSKITLLDIYKAVEIINENQLFNIHQGNIKCEVGANIESTLGQILDKAQTAMENELQKVTVEDIVNGIKNICNKTD